MALSLSDRSGFALAELLAVSGIACVCVSAALPLIQDSREEARRIECANRLTEITLGALEYQESNGKMPPLHTSDGPISDPFFANLNNDQNTGALTYILPFIGEQELSELLPDIATQESVFLGSNTPPHETFSVLISDPNVIVARDMQLPSLVCPSNADYLDRPMDRLFYVTQQIEGPNLFVASFNISDFDPTGFGRTSYLPSMGGFHTSTTNPERALDLSTKDAAGPMRNRASSISTTQLGDGASNVICWSESLGYDLVRDILFGFNDTKGANFALFSPSLITGQSWSVGDGKTIYFGNSTNSLNFLIGSNHNDGNNVTFCDGSVRFLSTRTSRGAMASLGCGNDGWVSQRHSR